MMFKAKCPKKLAPKKFERHWWCHHEDQVWKECGRLITSDRFFNLKNHLIVGRMSEADIAIILEKFPNYPIEFRAWKPLMKKVAKIIREYNGIINIGGKEMVTIKEAVTTKVTKKRTKENWHLGFEIYFRNGAEKIIPDRVLIQVDDDRMYFCGVHAEVGGFAPTYKHECPNVKHIQGQCNQLPSGYGKFFEHEHIDLHYSKMNKQYYIQAE